MSSTFLVRARVVVVALLGVIVSSCSSDDGGIEAPTSFVTRTNAAKTVEVSRDLSEAETAALERLSLKVPASKRAHFRNMMAGRIASGHMMRIRGNAEMQKLLEAVYDARVEDLRKADSSR
jgi:hypothetical protein